MNQSNTFIATNAYLKPVLPYYASPTSYTYPFAYKVQKAMQKNRSILVPEDRSEKTEPPDLSPVSVHR